MTDVRKRCTRCGEEKALDDFGPDKKGRHGRASQCRLCKRELNAAFRAAHPERVKEYNRRYYAKTGGAPQRRYKAGHPEKVATLHRDWKRRNFLKVREYASRRYRWEQTSGKSVNYEAVLKRHGWRCHLCGESIHGRANLHFDHVVSLSNGGAHTEANLRPSHARCNWRKNNRDWFRIVRYRVTRNLGNGDSESIILVAELEVGDTVSGAVAALRQVAHTMLAA